MCTVWIAARAYDLPPGRSWHTRHTLIIGDAAHAASPATGQGASMALEDAVVLAKALRDSPTIQAALSAYEHLRRPRVEQNIAASARLTTGRMSNRTEHITDDTRGREQGSDRPPSHVDDDLLRQPDWSTPLQQV